MGTVDLFGILLSTEVAAGLLIEVGLAFLFALAVFLAATHRGFYHHWIMLAGFLVDELIAKPLMVRRLVLGVFGDFPYPNTSGLLHISLAAAATVSGVLTIYLGFKFRVKRERKMFLPPKGRWHKIAGAVFFASWYLAFLVGLRVFLRFYT